MATWRKNREGTWVVFGPASEVLEGEWVAVSKKDGTSKRVKIGQVSRPFQVDGKAHVYGTPEQRDSGTQQSAGSRQATGQCCAECGKPLRGRGTLCYDSSGIDGYCCGTCARYSQYERSFA
jgi:hypothetical protein